MRQQPGRKIVSSPQKYACREERRLGYSRRRQGDWEGSYGVQRELRFAASDGEPYLPPNEVHDGRPGEGLSLRPKGAAALLHRKRESLLQLNMWRSLKRQMEGSHCDRRELWLCCTGRESPA